MKKNFAIIGAGGYVAPRHMRAIKETGHNLIAALDKNDSVGIIDSYFPDADFFTEFERFDRHLEKLKRNGLAIDYLSVCSPNYLHDAHIRIGLRLGANVICEKPLVLNPWNVSALESLEEETQREINCILQLRLHPSVIALRDKINSEPTSTKHEVELTYLTSRGKWYYASWKGNEEKSGGIATNIGIHFFDMLIWIFGDVEENIIHIHSHDRASGELVLEKARVKWFLSINYDLIPEEIKAQGLRTFRSLKIGDDAFEFSGGFTDLHTMSYKEILRGNGFGIRETLKSIKVAHEVREKTPIGPNNNSHYLAHRPLKKHPFYGG